MTTLADVLVSDDGSSPGNLDGVRTALREAVTNQSSDDVAARNEPVSDDKLPAKFKGKSVADIVQAYENLESRLGSMANDLGQQRALTDRILELDRKRINDLARNTPPEERKPVTASDILDRPDETLERVVSTRVKAVEDSVSQRIANLEAALTKTAFENKHPDYVGTCQSPEFVDWVKSSPLRLRAAAAANQGNWQIADELLNEFKAGRQQSTARSDESGSKGEDENLRSARRASFESGSAGSGNADTKAKGKTYRRVDLIKLRIEDPDSYYDEGFQAEILKAHAEGRIR